MMSSSCSQPVAGEPLQAREEAVDEVARRRLATCSPSRGVPYISRLGVVRLGDAVASRGAATRPVRARPPSPRSVIPGISPSGIPVARSSTIPSAVRANGRLCPAFANTMWPVPGSTTRVEAGDEHLLGDVRAEQVVDALEHLAGRDDPRPGGAQHAPRGRHHHRGGDALVGHVADDDGDLPVGQLEEVVEVAADLAGRLVVRGDLPAGQVGQLAREEVLLDQRRDLELLLDPLARPRLRRLLAARARRPGAPARPARRGRRAGACRRSSTAGRRAAARG